MKKIEQGTLIIIDIGRNVSICDDKQKSFFDQAIKCATRVLEHKIMSAPKHYIGVLLLGSKSSNNNMAEQFNGLFKHIELLYELQSPIWQMIRDLPEEPSKSKGDWVEALAVATNHFKNEISGVNFQNKKIILMTNFCSPTNMLQDDIEVIMNGLKDEDFVVDVIGPDINDENSKIEDLSIARQFVDVTGGGTATFEYAMSYLLYHKKKVVNAMPWNVDLSIGPNIKIPVSSYVKTRDEPVLKRWITNVKDPISLKASTTEGIVKEKIQINVDNQTVVDPSEIIKGYHYGQKIIPFSDCDKNLLYDSGEKCLSVYGFTSDENVTWQHLTGEGLSYVFGRKNDKKAQFAIHCLAECLHQLRQVGIVRRVYNKGNAPRMYALMPVIDSSNEIICLSLATVCFKDEIKKMAFPSTNFKKFQITDEQVLAFKDLIQAMDLTNAYDDTFDDTEAFPIGETVSPFAQYLMDCMAFRALNPRKPIPQPRDEIMMLFKVPALVETRSKEPLEKLKTLFNLKKVEKKTRSKPKQENSNIFDVSSIDDQSLQDNANQEKHVLQLTKTNAEIERIGTLHPIDDYNILIKKGKTLDDLTPEIKKAIENITYANLDAKYSRAIETMLFFRKECVNYNPSAYNDWLVSFKKDLMARRKNDFMLLISEKNLNFILKEENIKSKYDTTDNQDESQAYEADTIPDTAEWTVSSEINDMFDEA